MASVSVPWYVQAALYSAAPGWGDYLGWPPLPLWFFWRVPVRMHVQSSNADAVLAALDLESCDSLAARDLHLSLQENVPTYETALNEGKIVQLRNGTPVTQEKSLNFENGRLVPYTPTGPITVAEEVRRHIGVFQWVIPKKGPYKGQKLCISTDAVRGKYPPL